MKFLFGQIQIFQRREGNIACPFCPIEGSGISGRAQGMTGCGGAEKVHVLGTIDAVERIEHDLSVFLVPLISEEEIDRMFLQSPNLAPICRPGQ